MPQTLIVTTYLKNYQSAKSIVRRFVLKHNIKNILVWGIIFGFYILVKTTSFIKAYPTGISRLKLASSLGSNVGVEALLGIPHRLETVGCYAVWNFLCLIAASGSIWALLIVTKNLRGDEEAGRWEIFLSGQTTARRATLSALFGLGQGLFVIFVIIVVSLLGVSKLHGADFTTSGILFFALALIAGAAEFLAIGALTSQLMPVRVRAAGLAALIFGIFYLLRVAADTTNAHWLLIVSPLGWIEKLQPMYNSQPLWLIPIGLLVVTVSGLAVYLAGRRDLGAATFSEHDITKPHYRLLNSPLGGALKLTRATTISWVLAIGLMAFLYGLLTNGAAKAFSQSASAEKILNRLSKAMNTANATEFMGIIFFLIMVVAMFYAASAAGRIRADESQGYLDNFLVRPVGRLQWVWGRIGLVSFVIVIIGFISGLAAWLGETAQHSGVAYHSIFQSGFNAMIPVIFIFSVGIFAFGLLPRLTHIFTYGIIGWSFLISMLSSGLNINHWLLDTSILHQINLAPAVNSNWETNIMVIWISILLCIIGSLVFNKRDLASE